MTAADGSLAPPVTPQPFDPRGPLPQGTALLEASAGTGKTYAIAGLTARFVAEADVPLAQMLIVTFGRAATSEMRERVRDRLVTAAHGLTPNMSTSDPYLDHLASGPADDVERRVARLRRALPDFDAATIVTTHQFCHQVLASLGIAGGVDPRDNFAETSSDLVGETIVDLYLRDIAPDPTLADVLSFDAAKTAAKAAVGDPHARLEPIGAGAGTSAALRVTFATTVRDEVLRRKREHSHLDYDDLLVRVRDALADPVAGAGAAARLRSRHRVVLVDEFQDTDPVQWEILERAFHGHVPLVLIGDPKQAIYAFRGGDLQTYLSATGVASSRHTLSKNWRADPPVLDGVRRVFRSAALGDRRIVVHPVDPGLSGARLTGASAPVRLRVLTCEDGPTLQNGRLLKAPDARTAVAQDVAGVVVDLMSDHYRYRADPNTQRSLLPRDMAVVVRTNKQADLVRQHLMDAGVPAVLSGVRSVFATEAARDWVTLLRALEEPHRAGLVRAAALTRLVGVPPADLTTEDPDDMLGRLMRRWRVAWVDRGVPALVGEIESHGLLERLLGTPDGERDLTDVRHVAEAVHEAAVVDRLGPTGQREWLARHVADSDAEGADVAVERSRRLESDADAVQVLTVHGAKGLEFPVVLAPYEYDRWARPKPAVMQLHSSDGTRLLDVGGPDGPDYDANRTTAAAENDGESLRTCYVALTRAASHLVLWWAPTSNTTTSALNRLLFGDFAGEEEPPAKVEIPRDRDVHRILTDMAAASDGALAVERATPHVSAAWPGVPHSREVEGAARFERPLDLAWRRLSYTGLTRGVDHVSTAASATSEPEETGIEDEPADAAAEVAAGHRGHDEGRHDARLRSLASAWTALPAGAAFGTLVHGVLEDFDTAAADIDSHVRDLCAGAVAARLGSTVDPDLLSDALLASIRTPLGESAGGASLVDVAPADRLAELDFELPLAGGARDRLHKATVADLAALLRTHLPVDDPLAPYPDMLATEGLGGRSLGGYLVGSIDAVLRIHHPASPGPAHLVVDYKTNVVPTDGEPLTAWHYQPDRLASVMMAAHYPLQALLYTVALHRYLRWRQHGYQPEVHLGGVLYLFLRGLVGPAAVDGHGRPCGAFSWQPPTALVLEASDLLAGGAR